MVGTCNESYNDSNEAAKGDGRRGGVSLNSSAVTFDTHTSHII